MILRLRSALDTISLHHADRRVLIVCHQVVVLCLRYILEELDEAQILAIDKEGDVVNCGVCEYEFEPDDAKALRAAPGPLQFRRAADRAGGAGHRRARRDGRDAMSGPVRLDAELLEVLPAAAPAPEDGDKEDRGRALIVGGSRELPGAAILAGVAALRAGAGKLQIATDESVAVAIGIAVPEARVIGRADTATARLPDGAIG